MRRSPGKLATALLLPALGLCLASCSDDDDASPDGWTDETCEAQCEAQFAEDLEDSPISWFTYEFTEDDCTCTFLPCDTDMCSTWCQENEDLDQGICQLLECVCVEEG